MSERRVTVLLIQANTSDVRLIEEALAEGEEVRYAHGRMPAFDLLPTQSTEEAFEYLETIAVDAVLLDLALAETRSPHPYHRIQARYPELPVILLADGCEEKVALSLVRQGAQDYLVKPEIDCVPLARALCCSLERNRHRTALRSLLFVDDLTGMYTGGGFHRLAERHWKLAEEFGATLQLCLAEVERMEEANMADDQDRELFLLRVAESLREATRGTDVLARIDPYTFAVLRLCSNADSGYEWHESVRRRLAALGDGESAVTLRFGWASTATGSLRSPIHLLEAAERSLCENGRCAAGTGR